MSSTRVSKGKIAAWIAALFFSMVFIYNGCWLLNYYINLNMDWGIVGTVTFHLGWVSVIAGFASLFASGYGFLREFYERK